MKSLGSFGTDVLGVTKIRDCIREIDGRSGRTCDDDRRVFGTPLACDPVAPVIVAMLGGVGGGVAGAAGLGGYSNTNEGKVIAASFADNYNGIVRAVRANPSLQRNVGTLAQEAAAGGQTKAGSVFNEGDVLRPKIGNVRIMAKPTDAGQVVTTLGRGEEMIFLGKEEEGFLQVESGKGSGWVKKVLVAR